MLNLVTLFIQHQNAGNPPLIEICFLNILTFKGRPNSIF